MTRVLITGITGFAGSHLADYLLEKTDLKIYGIKRWRSRTENIEHLMGKIEFYECDLRDASSVRDLIEVVRPDMIFHLAAQSFVPTSWSAPAESLETNIMGELNLFEAVKRTGIDPLIQIAGCYSEDTRALTSDGFKYWNEIKEGDLVLSINPETEAIEYKKVKGVITQHYEGEMIHFKSRSSDLLVTPNHRLLVKKRKDQRLKFVRADEVKGRNYLPLGKVRDNRRPEINFPPDLFYLVGIFIGDGYLVPGKRRWKWSGLTHSEYISKNRDESGKFTSVAKPLTKIYSSPRAFLAIPRQDQCRDKVEGVLEKLNIEYHGYDRELYFVPEGEIHNILKQCNKGAQNKTIPQRMLSMPADYLQELFNGLIDSDGSWRENRQSFSTSSYSLVPKFIELCRLIGKWVTFAERGERKAHFKAEDREILCKRSFDFSITDGSKIITDGSRKTTNKKIVDYKGIIWCVEVEDNHNLLVERNGKISFCGNSSEEYGAVEEDEIPIKETTPLRPLSPYAVSKVGQDMLAYQYFKSYGMRIVRTRGFNHTGPRRPPVFVCSDFAKQIADIEKDVEEPVIKVGNLEAVRDFTDVRDMVRGYWLALARGTPGEVYNICSGVGRRIGDVLSTLISIGNVEVDIEVDKRKLRPSDVPRLIGDSTKLKTATGWQPTIPFEETLENILNFWRESN